MITQLKIFIDNEALLNHFNLQFPSADFYDITLVVGGSRAAGAALSTSDVDTQIVLGINGTRPEARQIRLSLHNFLENNVFNDVATYNLAYNPAVTVVSVRDTSPELSMDVALVLRNSGTPEDINLGDINRHTMGFGADPNIHPNFNRWISDNAPDFYHVYEQYEKEDAANINEMRHKIIKLLKLWLKKLDVSRFSKKTIPPSSFITFTMFRFYNAHDLHINPNDLIASTLSFLDILIREVNAGDFNMPFAAERGVFRNFTDADRQLFASYLRIFRNALSQLHIAGHQNDGYVFGILSSFLPGIGEAFASPESHCDDQSTYSGDWNANAQLTATNSLTLNNLHIQHSANGSQTDNIEMYISAPNVIINQNSSITATAEIFDSHSDRIIIESNQGATACNFTVDDEDIEDIREEDFEVTYPPFFPDGERFGDLGNYKQIDGELKMSIITTYMTNNDINQGGVRIHPNPSKGRFIVDSNTDDIKNIVILDLTGKVIFRANNKINNNEFEIDLSNSASGMYFLKYGEGNNTYVKKLIKL